jgi:sugar O-acyltransferase (sialic acid O-acetyltransferase NeuD family)
MRIEGVSLIGAGGHAKVVLEALRAADPGAAIRVFDESSANPGKALLGITIERLPANGAVPGVAHVAIGEAAVRERISRALLQAGVQLLTVAHPAAVVSGSARLAPGVFAAAHCVIGPQAVLGQGVIVNHGAVVDHDCAVGEWSHIAPNATLGGGVGIGRSVLVGAAATLLPGVQVGDRAIIGAGAVVIRDVPPQTKVAGVPARAIHRSEPS